MSFRNIAVFFDGTGNDAENMDKLVEAPTNVLKLYNFIQGMGNGQLSLYKDGVGTRDNEKVLGNIGVMGLAARILESYRWLSNSLSDDQWEKEQNKIFIFGFSRGAYTARKFSGFIDFCGIPVDPDDAELAWDIYTEQNVEKAKELKEEGRFYDIPIEVIGVWDTVKMTPDSRFNNRRLSSNVVKGYHAMAIDEKRSLFPVRKWTRNERVLQKWFAGVHSDIGGGYSISSLSNITLKWMIKCAHKHDLKFNASINDFLRAETPAPHNGDLHDSTWPFSPNKKRSMGKTELIDLSVKTRQEALADYLPTNLPENPIYS